MTDIIPLDKKRKELENIYAKARKDGDEHFADQVYHSLTTLKEIETDIKLALQNFQYELDELLNNDQDTFMNIDLCCQRWVYGILPLFKKHFGTSFTETSPSNFCEKGMQETLSATEKSLNALYEAVKYSQEQL